VKPPLSEPEPPDSSQKSAPPSRPMLPLNRRRLRIGHPPQAIPMREPAEEWDGEDEEQDLPRTSRQDLDPVFGYILAMALSVGLTPLQANVRYVLLWAFLAAMGGMAFLLGSGISLKGKDPGDLLWGFGLGIFAGGALMLVGSDTLATASERLFNAGQKNGPLLDTWVFQAVVFVMPLAETLFFRGAVQRVHPIPVVAVLASFWSVLMFFPNLGLKETPAVGIVFGTALVLLNFLYSYTHFRHGLAASLFCQMSAGTLLLLVPRLMAF
jgi:hypothetical protein